VNTFEFKNGKLLHFVNGDLVAQVAVENLDDYREFVPETPGYVEGHE
jgi:hypothetical protein